MAHSTHRNMSLDTQLELLRGREYLEYTFHSLPEYKEGRYKGQWKNAKPHGRCVCVRACVCVCACVCDAMLCNVTR